MTQSRLRPIFIFLMAVGLAFPLWAARKEKPRSADLSEIVPSSPFHWQKSSESDGLTVYWSRVEGSGVVAYRMEGILNSSLAEIASFFKEREWNEGFIPALLDQRRAKRKNGDGALSEGDLEIYRLKGWAHCAPREFLTRIDLTADPEKHQVTLAVHPAEDPIFPLTPGTVRGEWTGLVQLSSMTFPDQTFFRAELHCEMKGKVPDWVVNLIEQSWPQKAFDALRARVKKGGLTVSPEVTKLLGTPPFPSVHQARKRRRFR